MRCFYIIFLLSIAIVSCSNTNPVSTSENYLNNKIEIIVQFKSSEPANAYIFDEYSMIGYICTSYEKKDTLTVSENSYLCAKIYRYGYLLEKDTVATKGLNWKL